LVLFKRYNFGLTFMMPCARGPTGLQHAIFRLLIRSIQITCRKQQADRGKVSVCQYLFGVLAGAKQQLILRSPQLSDFIQSGPCRIRGLTMILASRGV
jgi:hypothetical protein